VSPEYSVVSSQPLMRIFIGAPVMLKLSEMGLSFYYAAGIYATATWTTARAVIDKVVC